MVVLQMQDDGKRNLKGSASRDEFKRAHKEYGRDLYASDADFVLISKTPPGVVAYVDYKTRLDRVTFTEAILYNEWMVTRPVYIIVGQDPVKGPFDVYRYEGGDWRPEPPEVKWRQILRCDDYERLTDWERNLRQLYQVRNGRLVSTKADGTVELMA